MPIIDPGGAMPPARNESRFDGISDQIKLQKQRVDRLSLLCQAMWEIIRDNTNLSDQHLQDKIAEIDLRSGKADGRMTAAGVPCPNCGRPVSAKHRRCLYCGAEDSTGPIFQV